MKQLNSHLFEDVYKKLGIDLDELGCIMLDVEPIKPMLKEKDLYFTQDKKKFWINGWVASKTPHITLLYGLLESGKNYEKYIEAVLKDWKMDSVEVNHVGYFDSPYQDEAYYCIVAHLKITKELLEGHQRLEFLPHINTFTGYLAHFTIAYIRKNENLRDGLISKLNTSLVGKKLNIKNINLEDKK